MASEEYPILENFNVFEGFDMGEQNRPDCHARFGEMMHNEVRLGLGEARVLTTS